MKDEGSAFTRIHRDALKEAKAMVNKRDYNLKDISSVVSTAVRQMAHRRRVEKRN